MYWLLFIKFKFGKKWSSIQPTHLDFIELQFISLTKNNLKKWFSLDGNFYKQFQKENITNFRHYHRTVPKLEEKQTNKQKKNTYLHV